MKIRPAVIVGIALCIFQIGEAAAFRPPSVPLVTFDPYLSIWSGADHLTDKDTEHWTKHPHPLAGLIRVDGRTCRVMGASPSGVPALPQVGLQVTPTRTIYDFEDAKIHLTLIFLRPALPEDLDAMGSPVTYVTWQVRSIDGQEHRVALFQSASLKITVNKTDEVVEGKSEAAGGLTLLRGGTVDQPVLGSAGDDHRINWGYLYAAAETSLSQSAIGWDEKLEQLFISQGRLPTGRDDSLPRRAKDHAPALAFAFDLGPVGAAPVTRQVLLAYDEIFAIKYFGRNLRPYWSRHGLSAAHMLEDAVRAYPSLAARCEKFDADLTADATKVGGEKYAQLCALAYRQCAAACGLAADASGQPLFFTKENTSNGDIATVDVFFPMDPQWLLLSPTLAKATLVPLLSYAASPHWKFPNAPHDLGTYPLARGTDDGGEGMPVEESGNMLILCDAVAHADGNADFVTPWWGQLTQWAEYLKNYGLDPEDQLCTDDFMGHLAHNANLSVKAILGLAAYADLCQRRGDTASAETYRILAKADAQHWLTAASDGDHSRLAFDKPNTWSQKYNLVWDKILGLNIFPPQVARQEVAYYHKVMQRYGVPLDSRTKLTKTDWSIWSATMTEQKRDFESLIAPIYDYLTTTTARSPFVDSYVTDDLHSDGMHARPVIGGVFMAMLADPAIWKKWASADTNQPGPWAPLPIGPKITQVIPTAEKAGYLWRYTVQKPGADWSKTSFNDSTWAKGRSSFGTIGTPGAVVRTRWNTGDIWLRRHITLPATPFSHLEFYVDHDEDVEVYVNGVLASTEAGFTTSYVPIEIQPRALALLTPGATVTLAVHCHQTEGGQNVDVALVNVVNNPP